MFLLINDSLFFKLGQKSTGMKESWQIILNNYENGTKGKL